MADRKNMPRNLRKLFAKPRTAFGNVIDSSPALSASSAPSAPSALVVGSDIPISHDNLHPVKTAHYAGILPDAENTRLTLKKAQRKENEHAIFHALFFNELDIRYHNINDPLDDTMQWLFSAQKTPDFEPTGLSNWLAKESGFFWVSGKAGSGKSTLMKFISDSAETEKLLKEWAGDRRLLRPRFFFYNRGNSPLQKSKEGLFRGLLYFILREARELIPVAFPDLWDELELAQILSRPINVSEQHVQLPNLLEAIKRLASQTDTGVSVCCFIDGLDEYEGENRQIIEILLEIETLCSKSWRRGFKILFSSRNQGAFETAFSSSPGFHVDKYTRPDIARYVKSKLEGFQRLRSLQMYEHEEALEAIVEHLVTTALGVFLWVELAVESLLDGLDLIESVEQLWTRVDGLPGDLEQFYQRMWDEIPRTHYENARRLFLIALEAPNIFTDIRFVSHVDCLWQNADANSVLLLEDQVNLLEFWAKVKATCGGLLEEETDDMDDSEDQWAQYSNFDDTSRLRFTHQTMKEFVRQHLSDLGEADSPELDVYLMNTHLLLLRDMARQKNTLHEAWMLQSPYQFFFTGRAEKSTQKKQLLAVEAFEKLSSQVHCRFGKICQDFLAQAVAYNGYTWVEHKLKGGHSPLQPTKDGLSLYHYAMFGGKSLNQDWSRYNRWNVGEPKLGTPDHKMVELLLKETTAQGYNINQRLQQPQNADGLSFNTDDFHKMFLCSPTSLQNTNDSPWQLLLKYLLDPVCNVVEHSEEFLEIIDLFLQYGARREELDPVVEQLKSAFQTAGDDKLEDFLAIIEDRKMRISSVPPANVSLFDDEDEGIDMSITEKSKSSNWIINFENKVLPMIKEPKLPKRNRVKIAVLDTGFDATHLDIKATRKRPDGIDRIVDHKSWVDGQRADRDSVGHGTHITALLLRMTADADLYIACISANSSVGSSAHVAQAIKWAVNDCGVDIISMSFGFPKRIEAIQEAIKHAFYRDVIMFAATSNEGGNEKIAYPANQHSMVIGIHSTNGQGNKSRFTPNLHPRTENFATLGECIESAWPSRLGKGDTQYKSGTSYATPIAVAAAAALLQYVRCKLPETKYINTRKLRSCDGMKAALRVMSVERDRYNYIRPWLLLNTEEDDYEDIISRRILESLRDI